MEQNKRRLSLGDIIRKMNEGGESDTDAASRHRGEQRRVASAEAKRPRPDPNMPPQPAYGYREASAPGPDEEQQSEAPRSAAAAVTPPSPAPPVSATKGPGNEQSPPSAASSVDSAVSPSMFEEEEEESFDLFKYLSIIMRRKGVIIAVTAAMALFSIFSYLRAQRFYTAHARLLFEPGKGGIIDDYSSYMWHRELEKKLNTHLELIRSRVVLERAAEELGYRLDPQAIGDKLTIRQGETDGEKNNIIELTIKHPEADLARDALNQLCRTYIEYHREVNAQEQTRLIVKLETQIEKFERDLKERESALREFKERNRMAQLSTETNLVVSKLSNMELALQQTQLDLLSSKERLSTLRSQIGKQEANVVQSMTFENPYQTKISELELKLNTLSADHNPDHYKIVTLQQQIDKLKDAMKNEMRKEAASQTLVKNPIRESLLQTLITTTIEVSALESRRTAQEQIIEKLNTELHSLPALEQRFAELQRETESLLQTLRILKKKYEEARVLRESLESDLRIFELAELPEVAVSSKSLSTVLMGVLVGLILGIAIAFGIEYLDQTLKDPAAVERSLELPLMGVVPLIEATNAIISDSDKLARNMLEPFRALRANLKHVMKAHNMRALMVCSAVKGEGKTTLAVNLAITFAMDGKKVIIVDGDLRRPQVHHYLDMSKETGLSDYLIGALSLKEIIKPTQHENLTVITSGERPPNPSELLGAARFDELMQDLRGHADIILYDSPALLPVSDSITMAPKMDGCVMVVRTMWTPVRAAKQAKSQIRRINANMIGGILNGVSQAHGYYPYYYGYYGYHAYKYTYDDDVKRPFSLREMGLGAEAKAREVIGSARYSFPRYVSALGMFLQYLVRKPGFWILLALLIGTSVFRYLIAPPRPQFRAKNDALVSFVAPSAADESPGMTGGPAGAAADSRHHAIPSGNAFELARAPERTVRAAFAHSDSLRLWVEALQTGDIDRFVAFYHRDGFRHPGGGFNEWFAGFQTQWLPQSQKPRIINTAKPVLESVREKYRRTRLDGTVLRSGDTVTVRWTMVWSHTAQGWRIAGQKAVEERQ